MISYIVSEDSVFLFAGLYSTLSLVLFCSSECTCRSELIRIFCMFLILSIKCIKCLFKFIQMENWMTYTMWV